MEIHLVLSVAPDEGGSPVARIQDIAAAANVSVTTVSRYLNGFPYVSDEAAGRIATAIRELRYHPNANARTLRSGKTGRIAVLLNRLGHPFYSTLLEGIGEEAYARGLDLVIHQASAPGWSLERIVRQAFERAIDGIIVATGLDEPELLTLMDRVPVVACDQSLTAAGFASVFIDHERSTLAGLEHLAERGCQSILAVSGSEQDRACSSDTHRRRAFAAFARRDGAPRLLTVPIRDGRIGDDSILGGPRLLEVIRSSDERIDGVFGASDEIAAGVVRAAARAGMDVPGELRVLGFDDRPLAEALNLSTIHQPVRRMGAEALTMLADQIGGRALEEPHRELSFRLVMRGTT